MQQSCTKRVIDERSEGLQAFSRHCLFPNRSVNFAQEFHHFEKVGGIERKRCIPSGWQGCVDRSAPLTTISCGRIAYPQLPRHTYDDESFQYISQWRMWYHADMDRQAGALGDDEKNFRREVKIFLKLSSFIHAADILPMCLAKDHLASLMLTSRATAK